MEGGEEGVGMEAGAVEGDGGEVKGGQTATKLLEQALIGLNLGRCERAKSLSNTVHVQVLDGTHTRIDTEIHIQPPLPLDTHIYILMYMPQTGTGLCV